MTILMSVSLLSVGMSIGFVVALRVIGHRVAQLASGFQQARKLATSRASSGVIWGVPA